MPLRGSCQPRIEGAAPVASCSLGVHTGAAPEEDLQWHLPSGSASTLPTLLKEVYNIAGIPTLQAEVCLVFGFFEVMW